MGSINYFVFHDRKVVSFATNALPVSKIARIQPTVSMHSPTIDKFMCGADRTGQLLKPYAVDSVVGFDQSWNYAVNNADVLYKHCCKRSNVKASASSWLYFCERA